MTKEKPKTYRITFEVTDDGVSNSIRVKRVLEEQDGWSWEPLSIEDCDSAKVFMLYRKLESILPPEDGELSSDVIMATAALLLVDPVMESLNTVGELPKNCPTFETMARVLEDNVELFKKMAKLAAEKSISTDWGASKMVTALLSYFAETGAVRVWLSMLISSAKTEFGKKLLDHLAWKIVPVNSEKQNDHDEQNEPQFWRSNKVYSVTTQGPDEEKKK